MPDFNKDLSPILVNKNTELPQFDNPSTPIPSSYMGMGQYDLSGRDVEDPIFGKGPVVSKLLPTVTASELYENRRYDNYSADTLDIEDQNANAQSNWEKATNGILKGANLAATTVAGGFGMLYGAATSPFTGRFADIWDNPIMRKLDAYNAEVDQNFLPNYYSNKEKNAEWYSTDNWMTTNFLFDKLVKNAGFAVGAMASGNIANAALKTSGAVIGAGLDALATEATAAQSFKLFTPLLRNTARAFSAAKNTEAAAILEQELSSISDIALRTSKMAQLDKAKLAFSGFNDAARRTAIAAYSSAGEASFEALQTSKEFRNNLIEDYKKNNGGVAPSGQALDDINQVAESVGKTSFFGNLALLGITEYVQLPYLLGSSYKSSKQAANTLLGKVDDVVLENGKYVTKASTASRFGKLYQGAAKAQKYVFDPKEAGQELGQFALQVGTQNYFKKSYESNDANAWVDGFLYGMVGKDKEGEGVGALVSKEGLESGLLGGLTGGLMQANRTYEEATAIRKNTNDFISELNSTPSFKQAFQDRLDSANRSIVLQQQQRDSIINGDELEARDLQSDLVHAYLAPRVKYGRFDMVMEDLNELRQFGSTEEGLASLKEQSIANINDTVESYQKRLITFSESAKSLNDTYKDISLRYSGEILRDEKGNPVLGPNGEQYKKYTSENIDKLVYAMHKISNYDKRIPQVTSALSSFGISTGELLNSINENDKPNREVVDNLLKQINDLDVVSDVKDSLKTALVDTIELSMRRRQFMEEYDGMKRDPLNYQSTSGEEDNAPVTVEQKEKVEGKARPVIVEKELEVGKPYSLKETLRKDGTELQFAPKITVLSKTLAGEYEVRLPNGKIKFLTPTEFKNYNISDEENLSDEMSDILNKAIDDVLSTSKFSEIEKPTVNKLDYVNSLDNQQLINAIEKEFNKQAESLLQAKQEAREREQRLLKNKEQLDKDQAAIEKNSGTVATVDTSSTAMQEEGKLKSAKNLFTSSTTASEDYSDPTQSAAHITRSRSFLNKVKSFKNRSNVKAILVTPKQVDALGLTGLIEMSYGDSTTEDILDVDNGFVAQVFIVQEKGKNYFVSEDGKKLSEVGEQVDMNQVVFQTMPTTALEYNNGTPRFRGEEKEKAEMYSNAWRDYRATLFSAPADDYRIFDFTVSRGIPNVEDDAATNQVGGILIPETKINSTEGLITISTTGSIVHNGEAINFPVGVPVLQYGDTLQFLNNRRFNDREAKGVFQTIKALAEDTIKQSEAGKSIRLNRGYTDFLQNVLFWKSKGKETLAPNQISLNTSAMTINLGGNSYALTDIANNESAIIDQLKNTYISVNNTSLTKDFSIPFTEYYISQTGEFITSEWKNYQSFLLSSKYPSGKARPEGDTPLTTNVAKPTEAVPYSFKQKYSTLNGVEFNLKAAAPKKAAPAKTEGPKIGEYDVDGETVNDYTLSGDRVVNFTASVTDGVVSAIVVSNPITQGLAADPDKMSDIIIPQVKAIAEEKGEKFDATKTDEQYVFDYLSNVIASDLQLQLAPVEEVVEEEVSDIESKKANVESAFTSKINSATFQDESIKKQKDERIAAAANGEKNVDMRGINAYLEVRGNKIRKAFKELFKDKPTISIVNTIKSLLIKASTTYQKVGKNDFTIDNYNSILERIDKLDIQNITDTQLKDIVDSFINSSSSLYQLGESVNYDAELAALESNEEAPESDTYNPDNTEYPDVAFRKVGGVDVDRITDADMEAFKEWHAANVPNIPFEVLANIITTHDGEKAWGVFENGVAKFMKGGQRGTEYHEIFEAIYNAMLTSEQQQALLTEFKSKPGKFLDRETGKKINYDEATDLQAKERIADDFADFRLGKLPARTLGEKISKFFKSIVDFFKAFVTKPSVKSELFKAINTGKFKEEVLRESNNEFAQYSRVGKLNVKQTQEYVEDITARAAGLLFSESQKGLLFSPEKITSTEMFSKIEAMYVKEGKLQELGASTWRDLKVKTLEKLRTLGVNFSAEDVISINDEEANKNDYAPEPFSTDWKKNSTGAIKFSLSTLLQVAAVNPEGNISLELPKPEFSSVKGLKLLNFSKAFATVLDKLSNTSSVSVAVDKLAELSNNDPNYVRLYQRVGANVPFKDFSNDDWRYFIQFMQTFTKQKPEALIQYKSGGEVYTGAANLYTATEQVVQGWTENMKAIAKVPKSIISLKNKVYVIDEAKLKEFDSSDEGMVDMLSAIGIEFPIDTYKKLNTSQKNTFAKAVTSIKAYLGKNNQIMSVTGKTLDVKGQLSKLGELLIKATNPNQDSTYFGVEGQRIGTYANNNAPSLFENEFNESETLDELLEKRPELNDMFSANSQVLKKGGLFFDEDGNRIKSIKVKYIQGTKDTDANKGTSTSKLTLGDRFTQEINQNVNGRYYILIPADGSTEWAMDLGNTISFRNVEKGTAWKQINNVFRGYLSDEVSLALDFDNRKQLNNIYSLDGINKIESKLEELNKIKNKSEEDVKEIDSLNIQLEDLKKKPYQLRFFKDILFKEDLEAINDLIEKNATQEQVEDYINKNITSVNEAIEKFITDTANETKDVLLNTGEALLVDEEVYSYPGLDSTFSQAENLDKFNMDETVLDNLMTFAAANYIISNIELHKVLFGDPYQFKIKGEQLDETKRIKSFLSPRLTTFDTPEYNTWLNENMNVAGDVELASTDPGYHSYKAYANTITVSDVNVAGSLSNLVENYSDTNEADAMSWISDGAYKEVKLKNGQWSDGAEAFHQWQLAYTRQNLPGYTYSNDALEAHDKELVSGPAPKHTIEVLKPIVSGNKYNKNMFDLVLDKFSQMPIYYSMVKGTNLENLYVQMMKQGVDYAIMESGRKVGIEKMHSLYNVDGSFNEEAFNNNVQVPWKAYGIQVETATEGEKTQTRGSQLTKLASMDLFNNGVASSPAAEKEYKRNTDILNKMNENAYNTLLSKLGLTDTGNGFTMDSVTVSETLVYEMLRREVSQNTKDTVQLDENGKFRIPFEASPSYVQIRSIIYAMVNKALISPKLNGGAHVQVPATMFESATKGRSLAIKTEKGWEKISKADYNKLSDEDKKKVMLTDDTLKFYTRENPYCEVMLPHWFKNKFGKKTGDEILNYLNNTEEGRSILSGIGFRIPTQALSSVEVFKVKGFLPQYMGATVVVPSEITTKAGSDFDIDKLNMYLKSVYVDKNGDVKLIKYMGSEEATKKHYGEMFDRGELLTNDQQKALREYLDSQKIGAETNSLLLSIFGDNAIFDEADITSEFIQELSEQGIKNAVVNDMYKKSLENEYYDSLAKLLTLPENFDRLISPVDDAGLKTLSEKLDKLRGYNEGDIKNRLLNRNYMTSLRHAFVIAKRWVGISAVNITSLSLKQKSKVYIDPSKFEVISEKDRKILGDGKVNIKHNTVNVDGEEMISLSGTNVANDPNALISGRLSGYATAFVDVAKDPFILKIIKSNSVVGTFMFLENIGAGEEGIMFLNQPIIDEYLKIVDNARTQNLFNDTLINYAKSLFPTAQTLITEAKVTPANFESNISDYYTGTLDANQNAEQQVILKEFLKYAKMAEYNYKLTQATNYDTTRFGSGEEFARKQLRTDNARKASIISSVDNVLKTTFVGKLEKLLSSSMQSMGAIFRLEKDDMRIITEDVLRPFSENEYLSADNYNKVALQIKASFLDYIIQTKKGLNSRIKELLVDNETSIAVQLEKAKAKYPKVQILRDLQIVSGDRVDGAKSVKLIANIKDAYDEDIYVGMMRELRDTNPELNQLYKDLVSVAILQGGYQSAISIKNIIPIEDYSDIVTPVVNSIVSDKLLKAFSQGMFQRNNFGDDTAMPIIQPKFFLSADMPVGEKLNSIGEHYADIYQYYSSLFPNIGALGIKSMDRRILLLSDKYNYFDVKNDFVKVPRVVTDKKTGANIDMVTGKTITKLDFATRKKKGDYTLQDVFGYAKVKLPNGEPLIYYKKDKNGDFQSQYVYKLINLYGDGQRASEHYSDFRRSVIENGTIQINQEIPDADIIEFYGGEITRKDVSLPTEVESENVSNNDILQLEVNALEQQISELKEIKELVSEGQIEMIVLNDLPKISPESAKKETGAKTGNAKDISTSMLSKNGVTVEQAAHNIWENNFGIDSDITTQDVRDIIIDILSSGSKTNYASQFDNSDEIKRLTQELNDKKTQLEPKVKIKTSKPLPGQLDLFQEEESWKEEDNNDTCVPF